MKAWLDENYVFLASLLILLAGVAIIAMTPRCPAAPSPLPEYCEETVVIGEMHSVLTVSRTLDRLS